MDINSEIEEKTTDYQVASQTLLKRPADEEQSVKDQHVLLLVIPPDGGWGWIVVGAAFFALLITDGVIYAFGVFLVDMAEAFGCPESKVALIGAIMTGFFCMTGPFVAALVNRFGYDKMAILGSVLASVSCFLTATSSTLHVAYLTFGVMGGIGFGMIYLPSIIAVGFYFERWRTLATSIAVCGGGIGGIILPLILVLLLDAVGWRNTFKIMGVVSLFCVLCGFLYRPLKPVKLKTVDNLQNVDSRAKTERKGFFDNFHNTSHPTVFDIHSKSRAVVEESSIKSRPDIRTEPSFTSTKEHGKSTEIIFKKSHLNQELSEYGLSCTTEITKLQSSRQSLGCTAAKAAESRLSTIYEEQKRKMCCGKFSTFGANCHHRKSSATLNIGARPLYRDDIFYKSSIRELPEYATFLIPSKSGTSTESTSRVPIEYTMQVTRTVTQNELIERRTVFCSESVKRTLATMLDFRLLKSPSFVTFVISAILTSLGCYTPYMFIKDRSVQHGIPKDVAFWLISCIGIANTLGRVVCGIATSIFKGISIDITYGSLFVGGVATILSGLYWELWVQFAYASVYGFSVACISTLRTIIIVEMLGLENLTNGIGLLLMFQGVASLAGTSISGILKEKTGDYNSSFFFAGGCFIGGAFILLPIRRISTWEKRKREATSKDRI